MGGEFTKEDRERLVKVEAQLGGLAKDMNGYLAVATSDVGYPRCAIHTEKLAAIEKKATRAAKISSGVAIVIVGGGGIAILERLFNLLLK